MLSDYEAHCACNALCCQTITLPVRAGGGGVLPPRGPPGQLHRRPSTPKRFCLTAVFVEPGLSIFCVVSFSCVFCVYFPIVQVFFTEVVVFIF